VLFECSDVFSKGTLIGVFAHIMSDDEDVREKAIQFLCARLKTASEAALSKETEEYVLAESKKIMEDVTGSEFKMLMQVRFLRCLWQVVFSCFTCHMAS